MSYFAGNSGAVPPIRHGKGMNRGRLSPSRLTRGVDRDERIAGEIAAIHGDAINKPGGDFLLSKLDTSKALRAGGKHMPNTARSQQSQIFGDARVSTPPKLRIRPQFTNDELSKLAPPDNRRTDGAAKMAANPTLVDKMYSCNYPQPHAQEVYVPSKKRFVDQLPPAPEKVEVAGFHNMGQMCKPIRHGAKAQAVNDPFIPQLPVRQEKMPRYGGNRKNDFNPITNIPTAQNVRFDATNPTTTPRGTNGFF